MSLKYVHFSLDTEKEKEKKVIDYIEKEYSHKSLKVIFMDFILKDMDKNK